MGRLSRRPFIVGFTVETDNLLERARMKRMQKKMDMIIANSIETIGNDESIATVIGETNEESLPKMSKAQLARALVARIARCYASHY